MTLLALGRTNPAHLPYVSMSELSSLPEVPAVYFVLSADFSILYVGQARRLLTRWKSHHRRHIYMKLPGTQLAWFEVDVPWLRYLEKECIAYYKPRDNRVVVPNKSYTKVVVRMPTDIYEVFGTLAYREHRSVPNQLLHLVDVWLNTPTPRRN